MKIKSICSETQARVLKLHRTLDQELRSESHGRFFVSGWRTSHPLASKYTSTVSQPCDPKDLQTYSFLSDSPELEHEIRSFHNESDECPPGPSQAFPSVGSSPLIAALMLTLLARGIEEILYISPVYYLFYYYANLFGIRMVPISENPFCMQKRQHFSLPNTTSSFLFSDPAWIFGSPVSEELISAIAEWQNRTGSLVLVDGTFQYTRWDGLTSELSSQLDPNLTVRLICPTKSVGLHGLRFAYLLIPSELREDIRYACSNITGATGAHELQTAIAIMRLLRSAVGNRELSSQIGDNFALCTSSGFITDVVVPPSATYYTMARLNDKIRRKAIVMSAEFFELPLPNTIVRINLLHPQILELIKLLAEE